MKETKVIEIDFDGELHPHGVYQLDYLPRILEKIYLGETGNSEKAYEVLDVHHSSVTGTTLYVSFLGPRKNVVKSLINKVD